MFKNALKYISENIFCPICDPKNIQGNLNELNKEERISISEKAKKCYIICNEAINLIERNNYDEAVNKFSEILNDFNG